jgi:hypothetical protein
MMTGCLFPWLSRSRLSLFVGTRIEIPCLNLNAAQRGKDADVTPFHNIIHDGPSMMETAQWLHHSLQAIQHIKR